MHRKLMLTFLNILTCILIYYYKRKHVFYNKFIYTYIIRFLRDASDPLELDFRLCYQYAFIGEVSPIKLTMSNSNHLYTYV